MAYTVRETFFRPPEVVRQTFTLPAPIHYTSQRLLARNRSRPVFVPIRAMQYLAVIDTQETLFVDSEDYRVQDGTGGRLILLSWQPQPQGSRDDLQAPVPYRRIWYQDGLFDLERRLIGEFSQALKVLEHRGISAQQPPQGARILFWPFLATGSNAPSPHVLPPQAN
ncbi:MAG: hypothetical protein WCP34_05480 [Pseudomonadota bacterium]